MALQIRLIAVGVLIAVTVLLFAPISGVEPTGVLGWDKLVHFCLFGLLLWSFGVLLPKAPRLALAGLAICAGGATEIIQGWVGRDPSWGDFLADVLGVSAALFFWAAWRRFRPRSARTR